MRNAKLNGILGFTHINVALMGGIFTALRLVTSEVVDGPRNAKTLTGHSWRVR